MTEEAVIKLWKSGLSKHKVAEIYRRRYNQKIKLIRSEVVNRHAGKLINNYEALKKVETILYKELKKEEKKHKDISSPTN